MSFRHAFENIFVEFKSIETVGSLSTNHLVTSASREQFTGFSPRSLQLLNDTTQLRGAEVG
jgi:hypothetical protein